MAGQSSPTAEAQDSLKGPDERIGPALLRSCQAPMRKLFKHRPGIAEVSFVGPDLAGERSPVLVPNRDPAKEFGAVFLEHERDLAVPPGNRLTGERSKVDAGAFVTIQPL